MARCASLIKKQYTINCVYIKARHALAFDRWLEKHSVALGDLDVILLARHFRLQGEHLGTIL